MSTLASLVWSSGPWVYFSLPSHLLRLTPNCTVTTVAIVKTQSELETGGWGESCLLSYKKFSFRRFWVNTKCNRLPCHTLTNTRSTCQDEHMDCHGNIFTGVQLVKIMVHIICRAHIHRPYCTWPLNIVVSTVWQSHTFLGTSFM
jgi:hypothetical protein